MFHKIKVMYYSSFASFVQYLCFPGPAALSSRELPKMESNRKAELPKNRPWRMSSSWYCQPLGVTAFGMGDYAGTPRLWGQDWNKFGALLVLRPSLLLEFCTCVIVWKLGLFSCSKITDFDHCGHWCGTGEVIAQSQYSWILEHRVGQPGHTPMLPLCQYSCDWQYSMLQSYRPTGKSLGRAKTASCGAIAWMWV